MATNGFQFPPPPPPPPVRAAPAAADASHGGRPQYSNRPNGRRGGRRTRGGEPQNPPIWGGPSPPRNAQLGHGSHNRHTPQGNAHHRDAAAYTLNRGNSHPQLKRLHGQAFNNPAPSILQSLVAPSVPQFGAPLPNFKATEPTLAKKTTKKRKEDSNGRRSNILGLTPTTANVSSSEEEDVDEEARYAEASYTTPQRIEKLVVTYKNKTFYLRTSEEITAWISERRKQYPTSTKRADAEQRKLELAAAKERLQRAREEARVKQRPGAKRSEDRAGPETSTDNKKAKKSHKAEKAQRKIEELQKQLEQQRRKLSKSQSQQGATASRPAGERNVESNTRSPSVSESSSDVSSTDSEDVTSSSGTSSSDGSSDSPSEEDLPKKTTIKVRALPQRRQAKQTQPKRVCYQFKKQGRCKMGARCHYSHEKEGQKSMAQIKSENGDQKDVRNGRMTLYQRLVKQEREKEANETRESVQAKSQSLQKAEAKM